MNKLILFASALAVLGLTSCEKELTDDIGDVGSGQVKNSLLQVRTRGSSPGSEATVAYPLQVYVFQGDECRAAQTIGDEGQTLNIALVEGTYKLVVIAHNCDVPVTRNQVTRYTGSFFGNGGSGGGSTGDGSFHMTAEPDWDSVNGYTF